jgi:small subunit ribosomal protein S21
MSYRRDRRNNRRDRREGNLRKFDIKSKKTAHVSVYVREGDNIDRVIRRFLKKCKKEKVIEIYKRKEYYEKPSVKRHRAKIRRKMLNKKEVAANRK